MEAGKNDCKHQVLITGAELRELNVSGNRSACPGTEGANGVMDAADGYQVD
jgi:hypothetical protein